MFLETGGFWTVATGCSGLMLGLEKKAVIKAREEAQDWQTYDMIIVCFFSAWEVKTTTIHFGTVSSHAETEQHQDVVSRKQHLWFIHGLGLDQHVSNKMDLLSVLHMLITRVDMVADFLCQEKANEQAKAKAFASAKTEAEEAAKEQIYLWWVMSHEWWLQ